MAEFLSMLADYALKILLCAIAVYVLAGFLVSKTRLLPFLAILTAGATIVSVVYIRDHNAENLIWLPVVLSIATQLFYQGEGFMNPKVHENLYRLVNVERKWNSLFEDYDDYELHFSLVETGGFFANTAIFSIFFFFYFDSLIFPNTESWIVYILPTYVIGMSIVDILLVFGVNIPQLFYLFAKGLMIILSVTIGFLGAPIKDTQTRENEKLYNQCKTITTIDYNRSYSVEYSYSQRNDSWEWDEIEGKRFLYDADLDVGAEYSIVDYKNRYDTLFLKDSTNQILQFHNYGEDEYAYKFFRYASDVGGRFKYSTMDILSFENYCEMTLQKVTKATQITRTKERRLLSVFYSAKNDITFDSNPKYEVIYLYNTDADGNPVSLKSIESRVYSKDVKTRKQFLYTPIYEGTGLEELLTENKTLKGYDYDNLKYHYELYGIDVQDFLTDFHGLHAIDGYDFTLVEKKSDLSSIYVYDSATESVALYENNDEKAENAIKTNDFQTYAPDYYIHNPTQYLFSSELEILGGPYGFEKFTFDNTNATKVLGNIFQAYGATEAVFDESNLTVNVTMEDAYLVADSIRFHFKKIDEFEYSISKIEASLFYNGAEYTLTVFPETSDTPYDVPSPIG